MSWVIPDERWSDHAGFAGPAAGNGPSYVANIVNAIGNSGCVDYINGQNYTYWQDTAIFIVWDDWGGWYDHVAPPSDLILRQLPGTNVCSNPAQMWGCGYTYGFRVPLLVVSAYTPVGYVSGSTTLPGGGKKYPYIHDFGSILRFIERNFGVGTSCRLPPATTPTTMHPITERSAFKMAISHSPISSKANTGILLTYSQPPGWDRPISLAISDVLKTKGRSQ